MLLAAWHIPTTATSTVLDSGLGADGVAVSVSALGLQTQRKHARGLLGGHTNASQSPCQWHLRAVLPSSKLTCLFMSAGRRSTGEPGRPGGSTSSAYSCVMVPAGTGRRAQAWVGVRGRSTGVCRTADGLAHMSYKKKGQCAPRLLIRAKPPNTHSLSE